MKILAIETSCDETAVAILDAKEQGDTTFLSVLGNALYSQATLHAVYGGVYPSLAKREHQTNLSPLATEALKQAGLLKQSKHPLPLPADLLNNVRDDAFKKSIEEFLKNTEKPDIDFIAVTRGPGLEPALWTGINFAEALGRAWDIRVLGIDHLEGHLVAALLKKNTNGSLEVSMKEFPILSLLISGGHTEFVLMKELFEYEEIGGTRDDAVGEAFDKVARLLDIPYPGGPGIAEAASRSRTRTDKMGIEFPRPMMRDGTCDFSFSGLKTAVLYKLRTMKEIGEKEREEIAEAFENAARDVIVVKARRAIEITEPKVFAIGGGVSANKEIRNALTKMAREEFPNMEISFPEDDLTGDNAVMIGAAGLLREVRGMAKYESLVALGNLRLKE